MPRINVRKSKSEASMRRLLRTPLGRIDRSLLTPLPDEFIRFVRKVAKLTKHPFERRTKPRIPLSIEVPAVPLDLDLNACGPPFLALSQDISAGGMALVFVRPVKAPYLLVNIDMQEQGEMRFLLKLRRWRQAEKFFEFSGEFEARVRIEKAG